MKKTLGVLGFAWAIAAWAQNPVIVSFPGTGTLTWENPTNGVLNYRVEWASLADGPWTNFASAADLDSIVPTGTVMSAMVPMYYRIVADYETAPGPSGMVLIPGGTNAGADPDFGGYSLTATSFYMDKYEVTKALWDEVHTWAITNGYGFDNNVEGEGPHGLGKATNHPVHTVNWYDCVKWCNARSQKEGRPAVYTVNDAVYKTGRTNNVVQTPAAGYRLPTDVEWEYAARGGAVGRRFPWSDSDEIQHARANYYSAELTSYDTSSTRGYHPEYYEVTGPYTSPVGSFAANGYGLHDMAGNMTEHCFDWLPGWVGNSRVMRDGSCYGLAVDCRVGNRYSAHPWIAYDYFGFRTVLSPGQ